jgi:hypothetical protein
MWICLNDAFLSVVADTNDPKRLMVRARRKQDLKNAIGTDEGIIQTPNNDCGWRCFMSRDPFKELMMARIDDIDYPNFKNSVKSDDLHDLYVGFWGDHYEYGQQENRRKRQGHMSWSAGDVTVTKKKN